MTSFSELWKPLKHMYDEEPALLRMVPLNTEVFCTVYDYATKADLSNGHWNPKRKLWVTTYFLRDI